MTLLEDLDDNVFLESTSLRACQRLQRQKSTLSCNSAIGLNIIYTIIIIIILLSLTGTSGICFQR